MRKEGRNRRKRGWRSTTRSWVALALLQVGADDEIDLAGLTPAERRRAKNRLHMRRKHAQATGNRIQENITRLKPGRKPKEAPKESAPPSRGVTGVGVLGVGNGRE